MLAVQDAGNSEHFSTYQDYLKMCLPSIADRISSQESTIQHFYLQHIRFSVRVVRDMFVAVTSNPGTSWSEAQAEDALTCIAELLATSQEPNFLERPNLRLQIQKSLRINNGRLHDYYNDLRRQMLNLLQPPPARLQKDYQNRLLG